MAEKRQTRASDSGGRVIEVSLDEILIDPDIQPRVDGINDQHVRALQEASAAWPPVILTPRNNHRYPDRKERFVGLDLAHRFAAAQNLGLASIRARILELPSDADYRSVAFDLNKAHGRPLSLSDRRFEAARRLQATPTVSNLETADATGLSPSTVQAIREQLEEAQAIPETRQRISRAGIVYSPPGPDRRPGELPDEGLGELAGDVGARVFSGKERVRQRRITSYLRRLAVALEDRGDLLDDPEKATQAVRLVLGPKDARALAERLLPSTLAVVGVAEAICEAPGAKR